MKSGYIAVPFKAETGTGFSESNGIAKFSDAGIVFEFESKFLGFIGGELKEVRVSLDEILDIRFRKGIWKFFSQIQLRLKNFETLSKLPNESGKVKLKIKREDFELAKRAVERMEALLYGEDVEKLVEATKEHLPPAPTSVDELFDTEKFDTHKLKEISNAESQSGKK